MSHFHFFFFSSRRRHTRCSRDWSSDVCSSDLVPELRAPDAVVHSIVIRAVQGQPPVRVDEHAPRRDRKSTRLNSSHGYISYAVFCLKKKKNRNQTNINRA